MVGIDLTGADGVDALSQTPLDKLDGLVYIKVKEVDEPLRNLLMKLKGMELIVEVNHNELPSVLKELKLQGLIMKGWKSDTVNALLDFSALTFLAIQRSDEVTDISVLVKLTQLKILTLRQMGRLSNLEPLSKLVQLVSINLDGSAGVTDITPLKGLPNLVNLNMTGCANLKDLKPLNEMKHLKVLQLPLGTTDKTLSEVVKAHRNLRSLYVTEGKEITDFSPIAKLADLSVLVLSRCDNLTDLKFLSSLEMLTTFFISGAGGTGLRDISGLSSLKNLSVLMFIEVAIADLKPLEKLSKLTILMIPTMPDIELLQGLKNLRLLYLPKKVLEQTDLTAFKQALPQCEIIGFCLGSGWIIPMILGSFIIGISIRRRPRA
jgi:hypothetical protein